MPPNNGPLLHDLTSDTNCFEFCDDQGDKIDDNVLEWIKLQDKQKAKLQGYAALSRNVGGKIVVNQVY